MRVPVIAINGTGSPPRRLSRQNVVQTTSQRPLSGCSNKDTSGGAGPIFVTQSAAPRFRRHTTGIR
jgi:hypothetical protein